MKNLRLEYQRFLGIIDICNGYSSNSKKINYLDSNAIRNSIIPARCLQRVDFSIDSGRESYTLSNSKQTRKKTSIHMQSATELKQDFEEVKQRVASLSSALGKFPIEIKSTKPNILAPEFLETGFEVGHKFTPDYISDLIRRYETEFRVRDISAFYLDVPFCALRKN